jgi:hypothetical protein
MLPLGRTSTKSLGALLFAGALLVALPAATASASSYAKPAAGTWTVSGFPDQVAGGRMVVANNPRGASITTLTITPGRRNAETCGTSPIALVGTSAITKFPRAGGRWAVGSGGRLIAPINRGFRVGGRGVVGTLKVLFDRAGRLATTGEIRLRDCRLNFNARKAR